MLVGGGFPETGVEVPLVAIRATQRRIHDQHLESRVLINIVLSGACMNNDLPGEKSFDLKDLVLVVEGLELLEGKFKFVKSILS